MIHEKGAAFQSLYSGQFTLSTLLINQISKFFLVVVCLFRRNGFLERIDRAYSTLL